MTAQTPRERVQRVWTHPAGKTYAVIALVSLGGCCLPLIAEGMILQAGVIVIIGLLGIFLNLAAMPHCLLVTLGFFIYFAGNPYGLFPIASPDTGIQAHYGNVLDLLFTSAVLAYFIAQFRLLTIISSGMPGPSRVIDPLQPRKQRTILRFASAPADAELVRLFATVAVFVVLGQGIWFLGTSFRIQHETPPILQYVPSGQITLDRSFMSEWGSRFTIIVGGILMLAYLAQYLFWYLGRRGMNADAGRLAALDLGWQENRRELSRIETWRAWKRNPQHRGNAQPMRTFGCVLVVVLLLPLAIIAFLIILATMMFTGSNPEGF